MCFTKNGLYRNQQCLEKGEPMNIVNYLHLIKSLNYKNSIFVDNTDNKEISSFYDKFIENGIGIVTCNKIACSSSYKYYSKLKNLSRCLNLPFYFEANVGAGLPIISTLNDLFNSGDKIHIIQAVLSGSLNFIFNNLQKGHSFYEIVKKAKNNGYTEPDPRIDLNGIDVLRKILIIVRECGEEIEYEQIYKKSFIPVKCKKADNIQIFYKELINHENYFIILRKNSQNNKTRLRIIAEYKHGNTSVGLKYLGINHPFWNLEGQDNMILFTSNRYLYYPFIKGAGAGAQVTSSGVFTDIIKAYSRSWKL
jgi:bifunctional aspartokinase / homoserine dehydrogenase 1